MNDKKLGAILCEYGFISEDELREALQYQKKNGGKLGDILVHLEMIENDDIIIGLSEQQYGIDTDHDPNMK
jgi:hypothetical protein